MPGCTLHSNYKMQQYFCFFPIFSKQPYLQNAHFEIFNILNVSCGTTELSKTCLNVKIGIRVLEIWLFGKGGKKAKIFSWKSSLQKYRRVTTRTNFNKFSKTRAEARKAVRLAKKEAWKDFLDSINGKTTSKEIYRKFNMLNNKHKSE